MRAFLFADRQQLTPHDERFGDALACAHRAPTRPLCLCARDGVAMYVAHLGSGFVLKRMPGTGPLHAYDCPSRGEPIAPIASGPNENTLDEPEHSTSLAVSFSLAKRGPTTASQAGRPEGTSSSNVNGLTLLAFLEYLWNEAELNRWQPSFAGRRSWATVRKRLLVASLGKTIGRRPLTELLYIPEMFSTERRQEIRERRLAAWTPCRWYPGGTKQLMILIGELKQLIPTRCGSRVVIKHIPDGVFRHERESRQVSTLNTVGGSRLDRRDERHWIVVATFGADLLGAPFIDELATVSTNKHWVLEGASFSAPYSPRSDSVLRLGSTSQTSRTANP